MIRWPFKGREAVSHAPTLPLALPRCFARPEFPTLALINASDLFTQYIPTFTLARDCSLLFAVPCELLQSPTRSLFHAVAPSLSFTFLFLCSDRGAVCDIHSLWLHSVHSIWLHYPQDRPAEEGAARAKSSTFCAITVGSHDNRWKSGCRLKSVRETPHFPTSPLANAVILSPSNIPTLVWFYVAYTFLFPCHTHSVVVTCMCFSSPSGYFASHSIFPLPSCLCLAHLT